MAGQTLGPRSYYLYTSDASTSYSLLLDDDLATAAGLTLDDSNPNKPDRFKPRGVYIEATVNGSKVRKFLICQADSTLYDTDTTSNVTIDTTVFATTGRKGESMSFARNAAASP